jgi:hypothetical protein
MTTDYDRRAGIAKPTKFAVPTACSRCGGDGVWKGWHRGTCYRCGGCGQDPTPDRMFFYPTEWTEEQCAAHVAKRAAQAQARAERKAAKEAAAKAEALARVPVLAEIEALRQEAAALEPEAYDASTWGLLDSVAKDIFWKAAKYELSEAQVALLVRALERVRKYQGAKVAQAAEKAAAGPVPTGKVTVEGEVVSQKFVEGQFGTTHKFMVKLDNGARVWSSVPKALSCNPFKRNALGDWEGNGSRVRFTATVEASKDDPTFGFASRPTQAAVCEEVA